jgi:CHAD domain-containing protein
MNGSPATDMESLDSKRTAASAAFRLGAGPIAEELPRVARARVGHAVSLLREAEDPGFAVHEARKDMKKTRAAIRLVRGSLGRRLYRRENRHYRDIGRGLSRFRDSEAILECLDDLEEWAGEVARFSGLRAMFVAENRACRRDGSIRRAAAVAADHLEWGLGRIGDWPLPGDEERAEELMADGLERTYRRGRDSLAAVQEKPDDECLHDWRKRSKDLWYQLALIERRGPPIAGELADSAHDLSTLLGDDHDLAVLRAEVLAHPDDFSWQGEHRRLLELIARRRDQLQGRAIAAGRSIYAEEPEVFVGRLTARPGARLQSR